MPQAISGPIYGRLSDFFGRRPIILVGLMGSALSYLAFGLAASLPMLFAARSQRFMRGDPRARPPDAQPFSGG